MGQRQIIKRQLVVVGIAIGILAIIGIGNKASTKKQPPSHIQEAITSDSVEEKTVTVENKIASYAVSPITKGEYPKLFKTLGPKSFKRANDLQYSAALKASQSPLCDRVETVGVSTVSTSKKIEYFIDCTNQQRIRLSETDLANNVNPITESQKTASISDFNAKQTCIERVKRKLNLPSSFDSNLFKQGVRRHTTNGNVEVIVDFTARNGMGIKLPASARCIITPQGLDERDVVIVEK